MVEARSLTAIADLVEHCLPGEWGEEPVGASANCVVYRATDIDNDGRLTESGGAERVVSASKVKTKALQPGDILVEASGGAPDKPVGRVALYCGPARKPALVSNFFRAIRLRPNVNAQFLTHQLVALNRSSAIWRYQQQTTGLINLKVSDYLRHRVWVPVPVLQGRIADILSCIDTAIETTEALIEKHQQIKAGLIHDLFTRGVLPNGKSRPSATAAPELFTRTALGPLPQGWTLSTLRACLAEGAANGIYMPAHLIGEGTVLVGQTALTEDRSVDPRLARRASVSEQELRRFGLATGDILVARVFATVEGVGRPALVPELDEPAVFESNMMRLRINASVIRPRLMFEWLMADTSRRHIAGRANASNQVSVNQGVLYPLPVPIPPLEEQDRMVARIEAADMRRTADLAVLAKLRAQKLGLMQDLLTGRVPVSVPEPAVPA